MKNSVSFNKTLKLPQIIALYIGAVLGSGILIIPGIAADISGPASLLSWGIMTIVMLPMALTMAFLSAKFPNAGGIYHFVTKAFNSQTGSLIGWYFTMAVVVGAPVMALTGSGYLCSSLGLSENYRILIAVIILLSGLLTNYFGIKLTGQIQIAVVITILTLLVITIAGSISHIESVNFKPFMPHGWISIGSTMTILFWCFLGWEAVSNMSGDFQNPAKDAVRGTVIAAVIISIIYFLTALVIVGTHSYGPELSDASLVHVIKKVFGLPGAIIAGFAALFVCVAPAIAYIGATSRMIYSLSQSGYAPMPFAYLSKKHNTPAGALLFLSICFLILIIIFSTGIISLTMLIQIPNATYILSYIGGCAAGVKLLKGNKYGVLVSITSLVFSTFIFFFVKWSFLFPLAITAAWLMFMIMSKKFNHKKDQQK